VWEASYGRILSCACSPGFGGGILSIGVLCANAIWKNYRPFTPQFPNGQNALGAHCELFGATLDGA